MAEDAFDRGEFLSYFRDEAEQLLQQIDDDLLRLESHVASGHADTDLVNSLFRALHTIKGSAGMMQFTAIAQLAHKLETLCELLRKERMPLSEGCVDLLFSGRDLLTDLLAEAIDGGQSPVGLSEYTARLSSFVAVYEATSNVIDGNTGAAIAYEEAAAQESASITEDEVAAFEAEVARLLHEAGSVTVANSSDEASQGAGDEPERPVLSPSSTGHRSSARQTIRVDMERLDLLLNLVGELVINRTRIADIAGGLQRALGGSEGALAKDLSESCALLARTTNEIQDSIMKVRMVPIGQVFERFPRLVRDVAKARGKEVQLQISGSETDLDKTIIDEVGEPLMHLLRNCVDHGIETPDERERSGKPRYGSIALNAYHEGNQIIIEVSDDGSGIDLDRVRARALKQGLIAAEERLSEQELIELVFTPGFSTAELITDVSGRGVGMDVVKRNITRLKGVVDVRSVSGAGTTFTIKLPLTLAIIQALLVRVAGDLYAIPLDSVIESQRVEAQGIYSVRGNEAIMLRGQIVPLLRVAEALRVPAIRDPEKAMVVIVGVQGRSAGLVVDSFEGEQEIVIKPLSDIVGRIAGISGATILGNGNISLIIDVHSLLSEAYTASRAVRAEYAGV